MSDEIKELENNSEIKVTADDIISQLAAKAKPEEKKLTEKEYEENFEAILKKTAFGTELRDALERIAESESGALIVLSEPGKMKDIFQGGFKINCKFTAEKLVELSKMDGAIIVDNHLKKIYYANVLLVPDSRIPSKETGTRHQAAERTAKQTENLVIAVSERTSAITLYTKYFRYKLRAVGNLIVRLQSVLDSLDEQKKIFNNLINYLNILEFTDLVTAVHVISSIQKAEIIIRGNKLARRYLIELGTDSQLLELRLKEIMKNVNENFMNILRDYGRRNPRLIRKELGKLNHDLLLDFDNIQKIFGFNSIEDSLETRGYRILGKIPGINDKQINAIVRNYGNLKQIMNSNMQDLTQLPGINEAISFMIKEELEKLKNSAMLSQGI